MIIVTGVAGFIGSKVTELLLELGHAVTGIDDFNEAYDPLLKRWRLNQLIQYDRFDFIECDISDSSSIKVISGKLRPPKKIDALINLAARAGVQPSVENPYIYFSTNVIGALNMLEFCRKYDVKKYVLSSTSSTYGENTHGPVNEQSSTEKNLSPYAASKKAAEILAYTYHHLHKIDVTVLRYFTVYGPAGRPDMSIFRFINWISKGQRLQLFGDGSQRRDFTYIDDIARGTILALKPLGYEIINLGSNNPYSLSDVISIIEDIVGKSANIQYYESHPADVKETWADISKAKSILDWEPRHSLETGLEATVKWYKRNSQFINSITM